MRTLCLLLALALPLPAAAGAGLDDALARSRTLASAQPALELLVRSAVPRTSRAGFPRFVAPSLRDPVLTPLVIARLVLAADPPPIRNALADLLGRYGEAEGAALAELALTEGDDGVRSMIVHALRDADGPIAVPALRGAMKDRSAQVRAAGAHEVGHRLDGKSLAPELLPLCRDSDPAVRSEAVFSLGVLAAPEGRRAVISATEDPDPEVRSRAVQAMGRIDRNWVRSAAAARLLVDSDDKVARIARRLRD